MMFRDYLEQIYQLLSSALELVVTFVYSFLTRKVPNLNKQRSVVVITGCDTGFGHSLSLDLSQQGYHVISVCNSDSGIQALKGKVARAIHCDVTSQEQVDKLREEVEKYVSQGDLCLWALVNNAGISPVGFTDWLDMSFFERINDVNYMGAIRTTKAFLPLLKQTKFSRIVNVSSVFGLIGWPGYANYCGPKHALEGAMKCLRMELRPWNIRVINVNPSFMKTPLVPNSIDDFKTLYKQAPEEIKRQYSEDSMMKVADLLEFLQENPNMVVKAISYLLTIYDPPFNHHVGILAQVVRLWTLVPQWFRELFDFLLPSPVQPFKEVVRQMQSTQ